MERTLLKSKIHRATVTGADLHYEGSIAIDPVLLEAADIREYEQVDVYDITSGERLTTYAISGEPESGEVCVNGAAARRVKSGDLVIIVSYARYREEEIARHRPRIVLVDASNRRVEPVSASSTSRA